MDEPLSDYLRKFYNGVRPWFFANKDAAPKVDTPLFLTKKGLAVKNIGEMFKKIMLKYFQRPVTVGTIRKVMETALSESAALQETEKNNLSNAMLHDPSTAQEYYVSKDYVTASNAINSQWKQFRRAFVTSTANELSIAVPINHPESSLVFTTASPSQQVELIPTSSLNKPIPVTIPSFECVPALEDSSYDSSEQVEQPPPMTRQVAENIAKTLVSSSTQSQVKSNLPVKSPTKYPMQPGDWNCSQCNYTNFARRLVCNRCGKDKNKRSAYEEIEEQPPSKRHKADNDITQVLKKATNKKGEPICQVKSQKQGIIWVRAKHVPATLL